MKNIFVFFLAGFLGVLLIGCGGEKKQEQAIPMTDTLTQEKPVPKQIDSTSEMKPPPTREAKKVETRPKAPEIVTLRGEIVDLAGFLSGSTQSPEEIKRSANVGNPLGLYDAAKGEIYVIGVPQVGESPKEQILPYVGLKVFVKGKSYSRAGVNVILISDIGKAI